MASDASEDRVKMDAIVVGGGPAGLAAAYTMAKQGLEVAVIERGEYSGSKNMGGLLYGTVINELIPEFYKQAPIERPVSKRQVIFLGDGLHAGMDFGSQDWAAPPYNNTFVVFRSQFDRWFASQVEEAGATMVEGMVAEDLIYENFVDGKKAVGVKIRGDEEFYADVIVLADGANGLLTEKVIREMNLAQKKEAVDFALGVKEVIGLPCEKIEDRFGLEENEGVAIDLFGLPFAGLVGGGFMYTAKEAVHVGIAAKLESVKKTGLSPNEIMDKFKQHPVVRKYLRGGELIEYLAHLIPEGGYDAVPELAGNGVMIVGDAAGFVNMSLYKEGTNHAMEAGKLAGETAVEAKKKGDFSKRTLSAYQDKIRKGVVMKDLKSFRKTPHIMETTPNLFALYPTKVVQLMVDYFTVTSAETKKQTQRKAFKRFMKGLPLFKFMYDAFRARKMIMS